MEKKIEFWEVEVKFNVRKESHSAKTIQELERNVINGIGKGDMDGIEAEDVEIKVK